MEEKNRQEAIREKGFNMYDNAPLSYGKIKVGVKSLTDATIGLGALSKVNRNYGRKDVIMKALAEQDVRTLRDISEYFYKINGIYQRACDYFATMYRFDWYIVPEVYDESVKAEKLLTEFARILNYLDNSQIKKVCGDITHEVIVQGAYYGYITEATSGLVLQQLPANYCRTRYSVGNMPAVEFNMAFFDEKFPDVGYRMKVLKMFPSDFAKGYMLYKQNKLPADDGCYGVYRSSGWYLLEPGSVIKFSLNKHDIPLFVNACPAIIDLDAAQDLDRRKQMQKLLKIIVQKLPLDKNGDLIFDIEEARDIHNNAVAMLQNAVGVDVLTTFTEADSIDMSDKNTSTSTDDLEKVERSVYNSFGISRNLFNTDGNLSLEKSILNDEGSLRSLLLQFQNFFDTITQRQSVKNKKKFNYRLYMLGTTQYNYKELSKLYKEQSQVGNSKLLSQIALGHTQSEIINNAYFENEVLNLGELMGLEEKNSGNSGQDTTKKTQNNTEPKGETGRPEKPDDEKSEKTIANRESMG